MKLVAESNLIKVPNITNRNVDNATKRLVNGEIVVDKVSSQNIYLKIGLNK